MRGEKDSSEEGLEAHNDWFLLEKIFRGSLSVIVGGT